MAAEYTGTGLGRSVGFTVTPEMVQGFAHLTGDRSSLHTDPEFGRTSMFRSNIVHGFLPVVFLSVLIGTTGGRNRWALKKLRTRFIQPIRTGDRLCMRVAETENRDAGSGSENEFSIVNTVNGVVHTTGKYALEPADMLPGAGSGEDAPAGMLLGSAEEKALLLEDVAKGDSVSLQFRCSGTAALYGIIARGMESPEDTPSAWQNRFDPANLLGACLTSTLVGMCMPGKYATYVDFSMDFMSQLMENQHYSLQGQVAFKTEAMRTIVQQLSINGCGDGEKYAAGKISVRVNEPAARMKSYDRIRKEHTGVMLKDKVVLVTGGSRGIGETIAKMCAAHGARVAVNYRTGAKDAERIAAEIMAAGGNAFPVKGDVTDREQVRIMVQTVGTELGSVDILVNNAVRDAEAIPFLNLMWDDMSNDIDVCIKGAFYCCQEVLPAMQKNGYGKIVNIATVYTDNPPADQCKYVVAKNGLIGLTRSLAVEFAPDNIQVNAVLPGIVKTSLSSGVPGIMMEKMRNAIPMQRIAAPEDVANAVVFLSSSLSDYTTGQKIMVTGGAAPFL